MTAVPVRVCIVGVGPRGLSVLERLCANAGAAPVEIHLVDPYPPGSGRVWRTGQNRHLLMNTVACQVSMFTDDSVEMAGPVVPGPSLWDWAGQLDATTVAPMDDELRREAAGLGPDSYPSRALYGHYLGWVLRTAVERAPAGVAVHVHRARAVRLQDSGYDRTQRVYLDNGVIIKRTDAVVLTQGHVPTALDESQRALAAFARGNGLGYVPPGNPAEADLGFLGPGEPVLLRGLGLCFFDYLALLTAGRGGAFERHDGRLRYRRGGLEPMIYAGSRRGVPYHARGENQKGAFGRHLPQVLTADVIERLRAAGSAAGGIDFRREVWPLIAKEAETVYYATLIRGGLGVRAADLFRRLYLPLPAGCGAEAELLDRFDVPAAQRWDWRRVMDPPAGREFADRGAFRDWLVDHLRADVAEARRGNVGSPLKASLDVLRDLRNEVRLLVDHGGLSAESHRADLDDWFTPANAFLSIGPPVHRIEEAIALVEAGVLEFVGPGVQVDTDPGCRCFVVRSAVPAAEPTRVGALIEARLGEPDLLRTTDPLLQRMLSRGEVRPHRIGAAQLPGLAVTARPYRVVDTAGVPHPRRFAFGVPTESVHWATAVGIRPGVGSVILTDSDAIARRVLGLDHGDRCEPYSFLREHPRALQVAESLQVAEPVGSE